MAVKTHELSSNIKDGVGTLHLGYDVSVSDEWQYYNQLDIELREDVDYGNKG